MKAARALVAGLALVGSAAVVSANTNAATNDVNALNYALQLEYLESNFYSTQLPIYDNAAFIAAGVPTSVRDYMILIGAHEQAHVDFLNTTLGSSAGAACSSYNFGSVTDVKSFLATAIVLEDTGVAAYTGAINAITTPSTAQAAATIATIEARHAAFVRNAAGQFSATPSRVPFPEGVNTAFTPREVLAAAGPFFGTCPYSVVNNYPEVRPTGATFNASAAANFTATSATPNNPSYTAANLATDVAVLNYALTLENLEASFYNHFQNQFTANQFASFAALTNQTTAAVVSNLELIRLHENAHVQALQQLIAARQAASGIAAVTAGCYDWSSITTPAAYLSTAATLENTGVSAYDGAAGGIVDTGLQQVAAAVAVVEGRHAGYLNTLNGRNATQNFQNGNFDQALTSDQILAAVNSALGSSIVIALTGGCPATGSSSSSTGSATPSSSSSSGTNVQTIAVRLLVTLATDFNTISNDLNTFGNNFRAACVSNGLVSSASQVVINSITAGSTVVDATYNGVTVSKEAFITQVSNAKSGSIFEQNQGVREEGNAASFAAPAIATVLLAAAALLL